MVVESLYLPDNCLQMEKFPAHVIWDKRKKVTISIKIPEKVILEEIFNVSDSNNFTINEDTITISDFQINGYLGLLFQTQKYESPKKIETIEFTIKSDEGIEKFEKNILLFRQKISIKNPPDVINIIFDSETESFKTDNKIEINNIGDGTAKIMVEILDESDNNVSIKPVHEYQEFISEFRSSLNKYLLDLEKDYPNYKKNTECFREFINYEGTYNQELVKKIKQLDDDLVKIFDSDTNYLESFARLIVQAYLENYDIIADLKQFSNYLNSLNNGKIIIYNGLDHVDFKGNRESNVRFKLIVTDLANNEYPEIILPKIKFKHKNESHLPIYSLFELDSNDDLEI